MPTFKMRDRQEFLSESQQAVIMSLPSFNDIISPHESLNNTFWQKLNIKLKEPSNKAHLKRFLDACYREFRMHQAKNIKLYSYFDDKDTLDEIEFILDAVFNGIMAITMFLSFFALCSSVSGNLMEHAKEIGILRALGITSDRIKLLFVYEAFILVLASSFQGLAIGLTVGTTLMAQQAVFLALPNSYFFPWQQSIIVIVASAICAFSSSWGPTKSLLRKSISDIFRTG